MHNPIVVAIPAKNEAERIGFCLLALALQTVKPDIVLLLPNNCSDGTAAIASGLALQLPFRLHIWCHTFPSPLANAGNARRLAMLRAAELGGPDGVVLTTDADGVVAGDWIERNLLAIKAGAELVCGRIVLDPMDAGLIPPHLHSDDALECELADLLDRIADQLDPDPIDPLPRHTEAAGASLGVTVAAFQSVGGMPAITSGEDRAFVHALACRDAKIRHDPTVVVTVSGRIDGRAPGGMADTIRRRMRQQDEFTDASVEPAIDAFRRIDFRHRVRMAWYAQGPQHAVLAVDLGVPLTELRRLLTHRYFGTAWAAIEARSPFLARRRVRFVDLPREISYARELLERDVDAIPL
jgi:hypothetical protein